MSEMVQVSILKCRIYKFLPGKDFYQPVRMSLEHSVWRNGLIEQAVRDVVPENLS